MKPKNYKYAKIWNLVQAYLDLLLLREKPKAYPVELSLGTTSFCNLKCIQCPREGHEENLMPFDEHLEMEYFQGLAPYLERAQQVYLYGLGEPMIDRGYFEKVRWVTSFGAHVSLSSNGTLLNEKRCRETIESGISAIGISLDAATAETFAVVRPPGGFPEIVENLKRLIRTKKEMGSPTPRVMMSFGVMRQNIHDLPAFPDLAAEVGCDEMVVHPVIYMSSKAREDMAVERQALLDGVEIVREKAQKHRIPFYFWDLDPMTYLNSLEYVRESKKNNAEGSIQPALNGSTNGQRYYCNFLWRNAMLQGHGELFPCCYMTNIKVGTLEQGDLRELRGFEKLSRLRNSILHGHAPKPCQNCPQMLPFDRWRILKEGVKEIKTLWRNS